MRDLLNKSLEVLVWVATGFNIIVVCFTGAAVVNSAPLWGQPCWRDSCSLCSGLR